MPRRNFKAKYNLPFTLIADHDGAVAKAFGVPTTMGFAKRQSFLVQDGKIVWADLNASTAQQAARCEQGARSVGQKIAPALAAPPGPPPP